MTPVMPQPLSLLESGEDVGVVSRILGHSTVSLTLDIYGHLTDRMTERAAAAWTRSSRARHRLGGTAGGTGQNSKGPPGATGGPFREYFAGEPRRTRTFNQLIKSQLLYH